MSWIERLNPVRNRLFHLYFRFSRPMTMGVRGIVVDAQNGVLLVRHSYVPGWHIPGGGVEAGETALQSLARELHEEGNVEIVGAPVLHGVFFNRRSSVRDHVLVYVVRSFRSLGPRKPDAEILEARFFPLDALPKTTTRGTRERLDEVFAGKTIGEDW